MLWLLLACAKQPPPMDSGHVQTADSGETGSASTGDTARTETGDSAGPPVTIWETDGPCGAWSGVQRTGTTWTYAASDAYVTGYALDGTFTTVATVGDDDTVTLATSGKYEGETSSFVFSRTDTWKCDAAGAWWIRNESSATSRAGSNESTITGWRTFTPGWLVRPATADVSATWTDEFVLDSEVNGVVSEPASATCVSTIVDEQNRTVDGGTFAARQLDVACDILNGNSKWIAQYLGIVETEEEVLAAYTP